MVDSTRDPPSTSGATRVAAGSYPAARESRTGVPVRDIARREGAPRWRGHDFVKSVEAQGLTFTPAGEPKVGAVADRQLQRETPTDHGTPSPTR